MKITLILVSILILTFANSTFANEQKWIQKQNKKTMILVSYDEDQNYFVEKFEFSKNEYQEKIFSKIFSSSDQRSVWLNEFLKHNKDFQQSLTTQESDSINTSENSLRSMTNQYLWIATESWNSSWETKYSEWIKVNGTEKFLIDHQIATDCADVAYVYRWIFSYIHKLPMGSRLAGSEQLFTHMSFSKKWKNLPRSENWWEDQAFRAALDYLLENTYTHSLVSDSYPIEISHAAMQPGVHHLEIRPHSGHTILLVQTNFINQGDTLSFIQSTVPRMIRELVGTGFWYSEQPKSPRSGGFMKMRWLTASGKNWKLVEAKNHPYYSLQQYQPAFMTGYDDFYDAVQVRLNSFYNTPQGKTQRLLNNINMTLSLRIYLVSEGFKICKETNCQPGDENFEAWSTPSRDSRLLNAIIKMESGLQQYNDPDLNQLWQSFLQQDMPLMYDNLSEDMIKKIGQVVLKFKNNQISTDPRDPILKRWGF